MSRWFLRAANRLLSFLITLSLVTAVLYAGYALWDNRQIYASAENGLSDLAPDAPPMEMATPEPGQGADGSGTKESAGTEQETPAEEAESGETENAEKTEETEETEETEDTEMLRMFKRLWEVNEEIGAWVTMPGTAIDYPVVRGDNNIKYVSTDVYGNFAIVGSIFLDSRNAKDYSDRYNLLYGHNMSEHRMFSDVNLYKEEDFFNENQKGYLYLPNGAHWLQSVSIIVTPAGNSWMMNPQSWKDLDAEKILELAQADALFVSETGLKILKAKLEAEDQEPILVALSTCSNEFTDARTILLTVMDPDSVTIDETEEEAPAEEEGGETPEETPEEEPAEDSAENPPEDAGETPEAPSQDSPDGP